MTLLAQAQGRRGPSAYTRLLGDMRLGELLSRVHASTIRNGLELERIVLAAVPQRCSWGSIFTGWFPAPGTGTYLVPRPAAVVDGRKVVADFLVLDTDREEAMLLEVKEGALFDAKSAGAERTALEGMRAAIARLIRYPIEIRICCWDSTDPKRVVTGLKGRFSLGEVLTGRDLCSLLGIDFDRIEIRRRLDQSRNLKFFAACAATVPAVQWAALSRRGKKVRRVGR